MATQSNGALAWLAVVLTMGLGACGDTPVDPLIVKAVQTESKTEQAQKQMAAAQKKRAEEKRIAKEKEDATLEAELEAATRLPDPMPASLEQACDQFVNAYDDFMKRGSEKDVLAWWDGRRQKLAVRRDKCERAKGVQAAACASAALMQPLPSLAGLERTEAALRVISRCSDKFSDS